MTNEELVVEIQNGNNELMLDLWKQMEKYVHVVARSVMNAMGSHPQCDLEDLLQAGYIAMDEAVKGFNPDIGTKFITFYHFHLKKAFADATGCKTTKQGNDPLRNSVSLDAPISSQDGEEASLLNLIPDPSDYAATLEAVDYEQWLHGEVRKAVATLPDVEGEVIQKRYFSGNTQLEISDAMDVSPQWVSQIEKKALQHLKGNRSLREIAGYVDKNTNFYYRVGVEAFHRTGYSAVEEIVLRREKLREQMLTSY